MPFRMYRLLPIFLLVTACGDPIDPQRNGGAETEDESFNAGLSALAVAQTVAENALAVLREDLAIQALAAISDAFTFAGDGRRDLLGTAFVLTSVGAVYERDDSRTGVPPDAVRFILYAIDDGGLVEPLQEIGYVDLVERSPPADTAVTIRTVLDQNPVLVYEANGFGVARPCFASIDCTPLPGREDSSRIRAVGSLSTVAVQLPFDLRQTRRPFTGHSWPWQFSYTLAAPDHGEVRLTYYREIFTGPDLWEDYALRIAFADNGSDSTVVEGRWTRDGRFGIGGDIKVDGADFLTVLSPGVFTKAASGDTVSADVLVAFRDLLESYTYRMTSAVNSMLAPAVFALTPPDVNLQVVTTTVGSQLDPDGYTVILDDSVSANVGINDTLAFPLVAHGQHSVVLRGFAANCVVNDANWRVADVVLGMSPVSFEITCGGSDVHSGQIAYQEHSQGNDTDIYLIDADGSSLHNLTGEQGDEEQPAWSPDGEWIAFSRGSNFHFETQGDIYVMKADGTGIVNLTNSTALNHTPVWSPDGAKIAFVSNRDGNTRSPCATCGEDPVFEIYVMNADGGQVVNVTDNTWNGWDNADPEWSPDGSQIAFYSYRNEHSDIYVVNLDGTGEIRLTDDMALNNFGHAWSPDGLKIAFVSDRDRSAFDIYLVNPDGSGLVNLTNDPAYDNEPAWSADGLRIAFRRYVPERYGEFGHAIHVMNADGTGLVKLSDWVWGGPAWSADATRVAFPCGAPGSLCVADADGGWVVSLAAGGFPRWLRWRPLSR